MNPQSARPALASKTTPDNSLSNSTPNVQDGGAAKSAAFPLEAVPADPDLALIVKVWPALPEPLRVGILAMVKATGTGGGQ